MSGESINYRYLPLPSSVPNTEEGSFEKIKMLCYFRKLFSILLFCRHFVVSQYGRVLPPLAQKMTTRIRRAGVTKIGGDLSLGR